MWPLTFLSPSDDYSRPPDTAIADLHSCDQRDDDCHRPLEDPARRSVPSGSRHRHDPRGDPDDGSYESVHSGVTGVFFTGHHMAGPEDPSAFDNHGDGSNDFVGAISSSSQRNPWRFWSWKQRPMAPVPSSSSDRAFWITIVIAVQAANLLAIVCILLVPAAQLRKPATNVNSHNNSSLPLSSLVKWLPLPDESTVLTRIAFGSCSRQDLPQPYWDTMALLFQPDLVVLMGDNVYGDCQDRECSHLRQAYVDWSRHSSFLGAVTQQFPVVATLDDHDYGQGDCHEDNPYKYVARQMFLEFFGLDPSQLPSLQGAGNEEGVGGGDSDGGGVYRSFTWGPPGKRVQLVLLDTRFSRSPFIETGIEDAPYKPYPNSMPAGSYQMLSASQWNWLRDQLSPTSGQDQVDLTILVSSIQVLNAQAVWEGWRHLPAERDRLLELLRECGRPSIVLSGDRHVGGMYRYDLESDPVGDGNGDGASGVDGTIVNFSRTVLEVTASSWTHTIPLGAFGSNCSSSQSCDEPDSSRVGDLVRENHFGGIEIDWESRTFTVALRRTGLSPDQEAYERNVPSDAGGIVASFRNLSLHDLLNPG